MIYPQLLYTTFLAQHNLFLTEQQPKKNNKVLCLSQLQNQVAIFKND